MGSSRENGRGEGSKARPGDPRRRRNSGRLLLEALEERRLLSTAAPSPTPWHPTSTNPFDVENGPLANLGQESIKVYKDFVNYEAAGAKGRFYTPESKVVMVNGNYLGVDIRATGDLKTYEAALTTLGMYITADSKSMNEVEGYFPLASLTTLAAEGQTIGGGPIYWPKLGFVGAGNNEGESAEFANVARTTYGVDGTGQKIGILSDTVGQVGKGLADSVATGDLPPNVQVVADGAAGGTDEGRGMLENVHDVAPGAALAFATGEGGELNYANNILALAAAGSTVEADDLLYPTELFYQEGAAQQAVNQVVAQGVVYGSDAGNASDGGYQSTFRGITATVAGVGTGTFQNFDPTGATNTPTLGISVYQTSTPTFQFDEPEVAGSRTSVTSQVNFYVLNSSNTVVSSGVTDNTATQMPIQLTDTPLAPGLYKVAIEVVKGPNPGHVVFMEPGDGSMTVDHIFGTAGGTSYTTIVGHHGGAATLTVGAAPWFDLPPYSSPSPLANEPFSSFGTTLTLFNNAGAPLAAPYVGAKPDITAPDGGNTSFFGQVFNTTQTGGFDHPPYPGEPSTVFNQVPTPTNLSQNLPNFFGTSAAVENAIGIAALIKQLSPGITPAAVKADLETTAIALDNQVKGTYNVQAGFGLVNAPAALAAASVLAVATITPGGGAAVAFAPNSITVTFNKPVNIASVTAASLRVIGANGATVVVGQPVGVDSPTFPSVVRFPITITPAPGRNANGTYTVSILPGIITAQNGQTLLAGSTTSFVLAQTTAPRVLSTAIVGRYASVTFSEPMNAATINTSSVFIIRANGGSSLFNANSIAVSNLPGATLTFNPLTNIATFDLTALMQTSLPTDHYAIVVKASVTDLVGNPLNGAFSGVFPSGTTPQPVNGADFVEDLGVIQLPAPIVTSLTLAPASDSGIAGDNNTNISTPSLVGQVTARFPTTLAGLVVYAEFNGINHAGVARGGLDLATGIGGRGFTGKYDVVAVTNAQGQFTIPYPAGFAGLPEGLNRVRVVVVGQADSPPFPGLSASQDYAFRVDKSLPYVGTTDGTQATSIPQFAQINGLSNLTLDIVDPVNPQAPGDPFSVDPKLAIPALDPIAASNVPELRPLPHHRADESGRRVELHQDGHVHLDHLPGPFLGPLHRPGRAVLRPWPAGGPVYLRRPVLRGPRDPRAQGRRRERLHRLPGRLERSGRGRLQARLHPPADAHLRHGLQRL